MFSLWIAACGTSATEAPATEDVSAADVDIVAMAEEVMRQYMAPVTSWDGPTDGPAAVPNKTIVGITCGMSSEGCARPIEGAIEAAELIGWEFVNCDPNFDATRMAACVDMAITIKADGIFLNSINDELIAEPLARARALGIEVVSLEGCNTPGSEGISFEVDGNWDEMGVAIANYQIWANNGEAKPLLQTEPTYKCQVLMNDVIAEIVEESGGVAEFLHFPEADLVTTLASRTVAEIQADPDINGLVNWGDGIFFSRPAMQEAGLLESVKTCGYGMQSHEVEAIREGVQSASVGISQRWGAWAMIDSLNRLFAGEEPVEHNLPVRLFTEENIDDLPTLSLEEGGSAWTGDIDWQSVYLEIWGVDGN